MAMIGFYLAQMSPMTNRSHTHRPNFCEQITMLMRSSPVMVLFNDYGNEKYYVYKIAYVCRKRRLHIVYQMLYHHLIELLMCKMKLEVCEKLPFFIGIKLFLFSLSHKNAHCVQVFPILIFPLVIEK